MRARRCRPPCRRHRSARQRQLGHLRGAGPNTPDLCALGAQHTLLPEGESAGGGVARREDLQGFWRPERRAATSPHELTLGGAESKKSASLPVRAQRRSSPNSERDPAAMTPAGIQPPRGSLSLKIGQPSLASSFYRVCTETKQVNIYGRGPGNIRAPDSRVHPKHRRVRADPRRKGCGAVAGETARGMLGDAAFAASGGSLGDPTG